jgi:hypothetical protein
VSDRRKVRCKRFQLILEKCAVVFNVLCKRNQCGVELCRASPMWSRNLTPPPKAPPPHSLIYLATRISLLVTLSKDGSEQWSEHLRTAQPRTCGHWRVHINIVLISYPVILSFGTFPQMVICIVLIVLICFRFD